MNEQTHYEALKVSRLATRAAIIEAYREMVHASHPAKTQRMAPFALNLVHQATRAAKVAFDVLSDPVRKQEYDASLPYLDPFDDPWRPANNAPRFGEPSPERKFPRSSGYGFLYDEDDETGGKKGYHEAEKEPQNQSGDVEEEPKVEAARYRFGSTQSATDIDITISGWRLYLLLSNKLRFTKSLTEISDPGDGANRISFEFTVERIKSFRSNPLDKIPELIMGVESIPEKYHISKVQTLFEELTKTVSSLTIPITASNQRTHTMPWQFGLDFDMNSQVWAPAFGCLRGICMIFMPEEPTAHLKSGQGLDTPECTLKWDKQFKVKAFCPLRPAKVETVSYGKEKMWRFAAVGYRPGATGFTV